MKAKKLVTLFLLCAMAFSLVACGDSDAKTETTTQETQQPEAVTQETVKGQSDADFKEASKEVEEEDRYGGTLTVCRSVNPTCLFYPYQYGAAAKYCFPAVESLGQYNLETKHYEPYLCESWERDDEALTLTLYLKKGIQFHDGSDFNAEAVKRNFELILEYGNGGVIDNPTGFEVKDDYTLVIQFGSFALDWEDMIGQTLIYSIKAYDENGLDWCLNHIVGTGPFVMDEYVTDSYMTFVRNENYWREGLPYLDGIKTQIIPDWAGEMTAFINEEIDWFVCGDVATMDSMTAMGVSNSAIGGMIDGDTTFGIYPNSTIEGDPFYDVKVRQAVLLYGIDWDAVTYAAKGAYGYSTIQCMVKGAVGYSEEIESETYYDPDLAKQMLAEAGYPDGFTTKIISANYGIPAATEIQNQLKQIGIEAEVEQIATSDGRRYDGTTAGLYICSGNTAYDYGTTINKQMSPTGSYKKMMNFSDEYLAAVEKMNSAKSYEEKDGYVKEVVHMLSVDECLFRNMFSQPNVLYLNDRVIDSGLETNKYYTPATAWIEK